MTGPLTGRVAWVTGASRGVGLATALRLARAGATVCLGARSLDALQQSVRVLAGEGRTAFAVALDLADPDSIAAFAREAEERAGHPTILVNAAGVGLFQDIDVLPPAEFERMVRVNLTGPWHLTRAAVPSMKRAGRGHVINVGSIAGEVAFRRGAGYCATKAALHRLTEALFLELREFGIALTLLQPGSVDTRFHREAMPSSAPKDQSWMLEPETVAEAALFALLQPPGAVVSHLEVRPLVAGK